MSTQSGSEKNTQRELDLEYERAQVEFDAAQQRLKKAKEKKEKRQRDEDERKLSKKLSDLKQQQINLQAEISDIEGQLSDLRGPAEGGAFTMDSGSPSRRPPWPNQTGDVTPRVANQSPEQQDPKSQTPMNSSLVFDTPTHQLPGVQSSKSHPSGVAHVDRTPEQHTSTGKVKFHASGQSAGFTTPKAAKQQHYGESSIPRSAKQFETPKSVPTESPFNDNDIPATSKEFLERYTSVIPYKGIYRDIQCPECYANTGKDGFFKGEKGLNAHIRVHGGVEKYALGDPRCEVHLYTAVDSAMLRKANGPPPRNHVPRTRHMPANLISTTQYAVSRTVPTQSHVTKAIPRSGSQAPETAVGSAKAASRPDIESSVSSKPLENQVFKKPAPASTPRSGDRFKKAPEVVDLLIGNSSEKKKQTRMVDNTRHDPPQSASGKTQYSSPDWFHEEFGKAAASNKPTGTSLAGGAGLAPRPIASTTARSPSRDPRRPDARASVEPSTSLRASQNPDPTPSIPRRQTSHYPISGRTSSMGSASQTPMGLAARERHHGPPRPANDWRRADSVGGPSQRPRNDESGRHSRAGEDDRRGRN